MKIKGMRWWIVVLVFLAAVLNYVDRQTLSALAPTTQSNLGLDERDYANIANIFLIAYTLAYLVSGKLVDRMGTRNSTLMFVLWWSLSNVITAWAQGMKSMSALRFSLRLGEAGIWPAASKIVSEWFPSRERDAGLRLSHALVPGDRHRERAALDHGVHRDGRFPRRDVLPWRFHAFPAGPMQKPLK